MKSLQAWFSGLAAFCFLFVSASAQADGTTAGASTSSATFNGITSVLQEYNTVPSTFQSSPMQPQFSPTAQMLQQALAQCAVSAGLTGADLTDPSVSGAASLSSVVSLVNQLGKKGGTNSSSQGPQDCGKTPDQVNAVDACAVNCQIPRDLFVAKCTEDDSGQNPQVASLTAYSNYLSRKESCGNKDYEKLLKQQKVMDCEVQQLQNAMNSASQQINSALQNNQIVFQKMQTTMQQMGGQMQQIVALVGSPDGKSKGKFQTLQDELNQNIETLETHLSDFQNQAKQLDTDTQQNEAFLQASKATKLGECLGLASSTSSSASGSAASAAPSISTAGATMCYLPTSQTNSTTGCPIFSSTRVSCTPAQAAQSAIIMSYITVGSRTLQTASRCAQANAAAAKFSTTLSTLSSQLGTDLNSWQQISNALASQVNQLSNPSHPVNVMGIFSQRGQACGNYAETWAKNAQNPKKAHLDAESKQYADTKNKLEATKNSLSSTIDANMFKANDEVSRIYAALSNNNTLSPDTISCTHDNPTTMQSCYSTIVQSLKNMGTGTGGWPAGTPTVLTGGSQWPNMVIPCQGLTDCTNKYTQARDALGKQMMSTSQLAQQYVQNGNNQVQAQVSSYAQSLTGIQQMIAAQYAAMKQTMGAMGARSPGALKTISCENLKPSQVGDSRAPGPYENPQNIAAVFSCQVSGGLVDFSDLGIDDAISDAKRVADRKKDSLDNELDKLTEVGQKLAECGKGTVGNSTAACDGLMNMNPTSSTSVLSTDQSAAWTSILSGIRKIMGEDYADYTNSVTGINNDLTKLNNANLERQVQRCLYQAGKYKGQQFNAPVYVSPGSASKAEGDRG